MELHRNDYFSVHDRDGYYSIEFSEPQVIIVPVIDRGSFLMIRAKRPLLKGVTLEFPAGGVLPDETAEAAALRELREETGIPIADQARITPLPRLNTIPSRVPQFLQCYCIEVSQQEFDARGKHDNEVEGLLVVPFPAVRDMIVSGEIYVATTIALISRYLFSRNLLTIGSAR